jgi:hypothetical protein
MRLPIPLDPSFPRGRFTGHVHCASAGSPLASAMIKLQRFGPAGNPFLGIHQLGKTDRNGNFDFPAIPVGTYHAFATLQGYVSPASLLPRDACFGIPTHFDVPVRVLDAVLPKVSIKVEAVSVFDFRLEIGGSICGSVSWQDGTPAKNNMLRLMLIDGEEKRRDHQLIPFEDELPFDSTLETTDGDGNFRFEGLYTGRYIIGSKVPKFLSYVRMATYPDGSSALINCASSFYWTGRTPYHMEAIPLELKSGADISGINIVVPMLEHES